jgi:acyl-CoA synthetase (NDP forming)
VLLHIRDEHSLASAWESLQHNVRQFRPDVVLEGVLVERMAEKGVELIVGGKRDPQWGPVLLAGFGGVLAEVIGDVRIIAPDLSIEEIEKELDCLRGSAILRGFRGSPALDLQAVSRTLSLLGNWMRSDPQVSEIDINPLVVYQRGRGAVALDALISIDGDRMNERNHTHE